MAGVQSVHPEYSKARKRWEVVRKIIDNDAKCWLRCPEQSKDDQDAVVRNSIYKDYAVLTNFTNLTKEGLSGLVFRKDPEYEFPFELEYLLEDMTGEGLTHIQFSQKVVDEVLKTGRCGLLADYPQVEEGLSKQDLIDGAVLPRLKIYSAESIINWRVKLVGSKVKLVLLVLEECVSELAEDGFTWVEAIQYRVFTFNVSGNVEQSIYKQALSASPTYNLVPNSYEQDPESIVEIKDANGKPWKEIPFVFIGSQNNDTKMDKIPLEDIALLNLSHYRNSADLEESGRLLGCPTLTVCGGGDPESLKAANPNGLVVGSRTALIFQEGATVEYLQLQETQLLRSMMEDKMVQAAKIGARLIEPSGGRETAEAARIRFAAQNSFLAIISYNCEQGIVRALKMLALYAGVDGSNINYELNKEYYNDVADANLIAQQWLITQGGGMSIPELRNNLREAGIALEENDDGMQLIQQKPQNPDPDMV